MNAIHRKNDSIGSALYTIAIVFLPILHQYRILPIEYLDLISILFILPAALYLINKKTNFLFFGFYIYCILSVVISGLIYSEDSIVNIIFSASRLFVIYCTIVSYSERGFKYEFGTRLYKKVALILSIVVLMQYVVYILLHRPTFLLVPGVTLNYGGGMSSNYLISRLQSSVFGGYIYRPSAVFIEPADFAYFVCPALILFLFTNNDNKDRHWYISPVIITVASVLTTSTMAIMTCLIVWVLFFYFEEKKSRGSVSTRFIIGVFFAVIISIFILRQEDVLYSINRKLFQLQNIGDNSGSSTALRVLRGWQYFIHMNFPVQIVGCGFGKLSQYYQAINMNLAMDANLNNLSYMNSFFSVLCSEGIIGFILYYISYLKLFRSFDLTIKVSAIVLFAMMLGGSVMDSGTYYVFLVFMISKRAILSQERFNNDY